MKAPKYVKLGNSELRLKNNEYNKQVYYRDAGIWEVEFKYENNILISWCPDMEWLHKKPLIEITKEEWKKGNKGYIYE